MKHKNSYLLVGYWNHVRNGRAVPDQRDIDPRAIKRLLPYVFILDSENSARPLYRLAGTALCERFGFELKGTSFLAHWVSQSGPSLASLLHQALKAGGPLWLSSIAATVDNGMVELETVLVPVCSNSYVPTRFVGIAQMMSDPAPLFGHAIAYQRLVGWQLVQEGKLQPGYDQHLPPHSQPSDLRLHPKVPNLRLVAAPISVLQTTTSHAPTSIP